MTESRHSQISAASHIAALQEMSASETVQFIPKGEQQAEMFFSGTIPAGTPLGHFAIEKYIGGGGMGRVYLARDTILDRNVAVKILPQHKAANRELAARFMNEAKSAARLNHEHIAQVYFAGEADGIPFIAFEYVEGINVRTLVEENDVLPLPQALNYLLQISHALSHAAAHGVIHRDVKTSNILITPKGHAKLIDMGLARLLDESKNDLTASGLTLGTFDYISPEQARDPRNADIRSDIYSLGCTFFFMLAGSPPFPEGTVLQKLLQHQGDAPPDIRSFQPGIPSQVALLIQKMMAKEPKQRFQTPDELVEALTAAAKLLGLRQTGRGDLVWTPARSKRKTLLYRHLPWIFAVALFFIGLFLMTFFSGQTGSLPLPGLPDGEIGGGSFAAVLPSPALNSNTSPALTDVLPTESIGTAPSRKFEVAFVPNVSPRAGAGIADLVPADSATSDAANSDSKAAGLRVPIRGGSLRPALTASGGLSVPKIGGSFRVRDVLSPIKPEESLPPLEPDDPLLLPDFEFPEWFPALWESKE